MYPITQAIPLNNEIRHFYIEAPDIARHQKPGQFVLVRVHEKGERIPLTIAGSNPETGSIELIVQGIGKTTKMLNELQAGDAILDVAGPLGHPTEIKNFGKVITVAGGVGTAIVYPVTRALFEAGNEVTAIVGAQTQDRLILLDFMRDASHTLHVCTDDGSMGQKGFVTDVLANLLKEEKYDHVITVGPTPMMAAVAKVTKPYGVKTIASLNPIMVDGTGMCGGCRVLVDGQSQFACVDGPEFDAHQVDFENLQKRNQTYLNQERTSLSEYENNHVCKLEQSES